MRRLDPQSLPQHLDRLYRAAWALCGSPHEAEDLVQETCARVLARPRLLRGQDELGYLLQALRNTFLSQRRAAARRPPAATGALQEHEPIDPRTASRPEEALQAREVLAAIAELPENHRMALVAVDVVGLSYREAGALLDTREATIATRVFRAREQLARLLERERRAGGATGSASAQSQAGVTQEPVQPAPALVQRRSPPADGARGAARGTVANPGSVLLSEVSGEA